MIEDLPKENAFKDENILSILKQLEQIKPYPLMIVTNEEYMRAIDYRAKEVGICLIVAKSFANKR